MVRDVATGINNEAIPELQSYPTHEWMTLQAHSCERGRYKVARGLGIVAVYLCIGRLQQ